MTDVIVNLFVDVHLYKANLTLFRTSNGLLIAFSASEYSLQQMLPTVVADNSTRSSGNAVFLRHSSRFDIKFQAIYAELNSNTR
jgi:hypothetical protein